MSNSADEIQQNIADTMIALTEHKRAIKSLEESLSILRAQKCRIVNNGNHNYVDDRDHNVVYYYQPKRKTCTMCDSILIKDA